MAVLTDFFCKMYFLCVSQSHKKTLGNFFLVLPPERAVFFLVGGSGCPVLQGGVLPAAVRTPSLESASNGLSINYGCPNFQRGGSAVSRSRFYCLHLLRVSSWLSCPQATRASSCLRSPLGALASSP